MSIRIAAWNLKEALAQPKQMPAALEQIEQLDADVAVLSDAYSLTNDLHGSTPDTWYEAQHRLQALGYKYQQVEYEDTAQWRHDRYIIMLSRLAMSHAGAIHLGSRNALEAQVQDPSHNSPVHIVGAHFDDRAEFTRLQHVFALLEFVDVNRPTALAGDLNNLHSDDLWARLLRSPLKQAGRWIPTRRLQSYSVRGAEMAKGESLEVLENHRFRDADRLHRPTMPARLPLIQPDHIMVTESVIVQDYQVMERSPASDHRAIRAIISS